MKIQQLFKGVSPNPFPLGWDNIDIPAIASDSRKVTLGGLFVALQGPTGNGAEFIPQAVKQGAAVVVQTGQKPCVQVQGPTLFLHVPNTHEALQELLNNFYQNVSKEIRVIGITGTNGKTTITYLLESIFNSVAKPCGVIGTVNYRYGGKVFPAKNTTPGMIENHQLLHDMYSAKCAYCAMEVSSHALAQGRTDGIDFRVAVFTNLTSDHLDYHKDREDYFLAKSKLFTGLASGAIALINHDDAFAQRLIKMSHGRVMTYGVNNRSDFSARDVRLSFAGTDFIFKAPGGEIALRTPLIGMHNAYNILTAAGVAHAEGLTLGQIKKGIEALHNVPGRLERVSVGQKFTVLVDYAHTEDALKNVLTSLRKVNPGRIFLVFGCGGDRDRTKRPLMGRVASDLADFSIITNDNPRREEPQDIAGQITPGFKNKSFRIILDRRAAIKEALCLAKDDDVVLIAGKGHEDYQIFKDRTVPFDEKKIAEECLKEVLEKHF